MIDDDWQPEDDEERLGPYKQIIANNQPKTTVLYFSPSSMVILPQITWWRKILIYILFGFKTKDTK